LALGNSLNRDHHENKGASVLGQTRSRPTGATVHALLKSMRKRVKKHKTILLFPRVLDNVSDRDQNHIFGTAPILQLYAQASEESPGQRTDRQ
ncbi:hypothetical protein J6590_102614, partial [Homalodisca vitripennis]